MFNNIIEFCAKHKTAANLIMILMLAIGLVSANRLNKQFFPNFDIEEIYVMIEWSGATAEDIDANVIQPLEPELRTIANVKNVNSTSIDGRGYTQLEFEFGTDMQRALSDVESAVSQVSFPKDVETPKIVKPEFFDTISRIVIYGDFSLSSLEHYAKIIKEDLLQIGIDKVEINGLPEKEIRIEISESELAKLGLSLSDISKSISNESIDIPAGRFADGALKVRSLGLKKNANDYENMQISYKDDGSSVRLGNISEIKEDFKKPSAILKHNEQNALEIHVQRSKSSDSVKLNQILQNYIKDKEEVLPNGLKIAQHDIASDLIIQRINLMIKNGIGGLVLVCLVLFLFLPFRVAFWVAVGIPIAFLATFGVMLFANQTINMISLFGLIMALGIVVDDAIVIGEHSEYLRKRRKLSMHDAAILAANRMSAPVICAMLTTVAAFLPLFMVKGIIGAIISAIPAVVCAVLLASLIECFLVLPAHLGHYGSSDNNKESTFRLKFDNGFNFFKDKIFGFLVTKSFNYRYVTFAFASGLLLFAIGMMSSNRVGFVFFSAPEADRVFVNATMVSGSTRTQTENMLTEIESALKKTKSELSKGEDLIKFHFSVLGSNITGGPEKLSSGDDLRAGMMIELITADKRKIRVDDFISKLRKNINSLPGLETLIVRAPRGGPPGRDLDIRILGNDLNELKLHAQKIINIANSLPGASDLEEDLNYGTEERIIKLTSLGRSLGFTVQSIGSQVRIALDGSVITRFPRADEMVTVRLSRPKDEISTDSLYNLRINSPDGNFVKLGDVAEIKNRLGFSSVKRKNGFREVGIKGDLDTDVLNSRQAVNKLKKSEFGKYVDENNLRFRFDGRDQERKESFADMQIGGMLALLSIYVILAWVFASWTRPFAVMIMIPFGLIGAVVGHYFMGLSMNILSLFALIALSGIVVNNSIILVATIERRIVELKGDVEKAIIQGSIDRLRPVLLTSMTTIGGLSALMFETSLQAQFLIPMATTIVFGLAVTTCLVLFLVPATLGIGRDIEKFISPIFSSIFNFQKSNSK